MVSELPRPPRPRPSPGRVTPRMIRAAWAAWHDRHQGSIGPGPGFVEAIEAALAVEEEDKRHEDQSR